MPVTVDVEYCGSCGHLKQFEELKEIILTEVPGVQLRGREGRRGSFEVDVLGTKIHSKLETLAFPDYHDVAQLAKEANDGRKPERKAKQQPITNCSIA